jgi:CRISPR/Cas system CSM-associated protein Csm5 (group 7 of RAMP superfamily)
LKVGDSTGLDLSSDFNPIPTIIMLAEGLPRNNAQESSRNSKGYASKKSTGMLQTLTEYIPGKLLPNGQEFTIHHRLVIDKDLEHKWQLPNYMDRDNKDGTDITCESIVKRCKELFVRQYDKDKAYFNQSKNIDSETNDTMTKLKEEFDSIESDPIQCIARLGWGSGFDAMSLNSVLDQQHSFTPITRKLADGKYPQGWVKLKFEKL